MNLCDDHAWAGEGDCPKCETAFAGLVPPAATQPKLAVWFGGMPESNGKRNWTVLLHRAGEGLETGITIERCEYYDRARYEADRMRYLIGEIPVEPFILDYDENLKEPGPEPTALHRLSPRRKKS